MNFIIALLLFVLYTFFAFFGYKAFSVIKVYYEEILEIPTTLTPTAKRVYVRDRIVSIFACAFAGVLSYGFILFLIWLSVGC